jgi:hypothetical protein
MLHRVGTMLRATLLCLVLAGCTGELVPSGNAPWGGDPRRTMFEEDVSPILELRCASCHAGVGAGPGGAPRFLGTGATTEYYATLVAGAELDYQDPGESRLIVRGVHYGGAGPAFEPAEELPTVRVWIEEEAAAR